MSKKRRSRRNTTAPPPPVVETQEPVVEIQEPPSEPRGRSFRFWPEDQPLPREYVKAQPRQVPCPKCRRLALDTGAQAVMCTSSGSGIAYFRCRACDYRFSLPVRTV